MEISSRGLLDKRGRVLAHWCDDNAIAELMLRLWRGVNSVGVSEDSSFGCRASVDVAV
jgi:hypothetical protein